MNSKKEITNFVLYGDTDSLFINIGMFLDKHLKSDWRSLPDDVIMDVILKLSSVIEEYVNDKSYRETQRKIYNSAETDFRIKFKQEIIAKSILFVKKKKYSAWNVNEEGAPVDYIKTTGLEIVRSDTPEIVRPLLKEIMTMILKGSSDTEISNKISEVKKNLLEAKPEEISTNIGVHDISKYVDGSNSYIKGTPFHIKAVSNYRSLLSILKLNGVYEDIIDGSKVKIVYLKKNKFGFENIAFIRWPKEFDKVIQIDYNTQIEKVFLNKVQILLEPMNKENIMNNKAKETMNLFF